MPADSILAALAMIRTTARPLAALSQDYIGTRAGGRGPHRRSVPAHESVAGPEWRFLNVCFCAAVGG